MADLKISQLNAITVLTPATDVLPVVDSGGVTKKITTNQILGSGGTATLASATITGDLTVDTSTLKVDSTNNRVGIGTPSPAAQLHVAASGSDTAVIRLAAAGGRTFDIGSTAAGYGSANNLIIYDITGSAERFRIDSTGIFTFSNVGGVAGTAMTLNSTGLGVGTSPSYNIDVLAATLPTISVRSTLAGASNARLYLECAGTNSGHITYNRSLQALQLGANGGTTAQVTLDSLGNVGIGVTPSYKLDTYTTLQGAVTAKQFANRTANKILVKRFFGITADTALFSVECGTAGAGAMAAFEINVFATGQKSGSSGDRQFYGKWYVTRNLAGAFTITSAFSSGSSGAFTVAASGTSLNVNGIFSVISDGSACVEVTGYIGGRDTVVETALNVTMP